MPIARPDPQTLMQLALGLDVAEDEEYTPSGHETAEQVAARLEAARTLFLRQDRKPGWFADYEDLIRAGWPHKIAAYIAWAASPRKLRQPGTLEEFASTVLGLASARQVYKWRAKNPAIDDCVKLLQAAPLFAHRRDIYEALITAATDPDYKSHADRKLALELLGDYVPRQQIDGNLGRPRDLSELTDEELDRLSAEVLRKVDEADDDPADDDSPGWEAHR